MKFAKWRRTYNRAFEQHVLGLSRFMTILDVAKHLGVSWGTRLQVKRTDMAANWLNWPTGERATVT